MKHIYECSMLCQAKHNNLARTSKNRCLFIITHINKHNKKPDIFRKFIVIWVQSSVSTSDDNSLIFIKKQDFCTKERNKITGHKFDLISLI